MMKFARQKQEPTATKWVGARAVAWIVLTTLTTASFAESGLEAKVKAAYLYNFTKFVDWPDLPAEGFTICVVGSEAVGQNLSELASRQTKGRSLSIETGVPSDPTHCQVLFIGQREPRAVDLIGRTRGGSVLTVSDATNFARQGGIIGFFDEGGKIKMEINADRANAAKLKISSKLMEVGRLVP
jgi:hypothetical protein